MASPELRINVSPKARSRQLRGESDFGEGLSNDLVDVLPSSRVHAVPHRRVEGKHHLLPSGLLGRNHHPHRPPGQFHQLGVLRRNLPTLIQHRQGHDIPANLDIPNPLDLQHPAGGHPRPGAHGVEPEIGDARHECEP